MDGLLMKFVMKWFCGKLQRFIGVFICMIMLLCIIMMWLLSVIVFIWLWVMQMMVVLRWWWSCEICECIFMCSLVLRFESGLFIRNIDGLCMMVWFIVMCWCCLFESFLGLCLSRCLICKIWVVLCMCLLIFLCGVLCSLRLNVMFLQMFMCGQSVQFWKIIVMLWFLGGMLLMMWLLICSILLLMFLRFVIICRVVDLLQFDGFMKIMNLWLVILRLKFFIVCCLLLQYLLMCLRIILVMMFIFLLFLFFFVNEGLGNWGFG